MLASRYSNDESSNETVKLLIDAGANLDLKNEDGFTAYQLGNKEAKKLLNEFVMLKVWKIRELSTNKMYDAFSVYNIAGNVFLFLKPK